MKRKFDAPLDSLTPKKARNDGYGPSADAKRNTKTVRFGDTPTKNSIVHGAGDGSKPTKQHKPKKVKSANKKQAKAPPPPAEIGPALDYLRKWKRERGNWKFNKNLQSTLIKRVFDDGDVPATDIDCFYEYIRDIQGFVRTRLREKAMEVKDKDVADGAKGFASGTDALDDKQETYETILSDLLQAQHLERKRKVFDEVQFVSSSDAGDAVIKRLVKRMRAEIVLDELSDGEQTETSRTTQSSDTMVTGDESAGEVGNDVKPRASDLSGKRRRKLRTNMDDSSSSSESGSDSDSDASSSSSDESDGSDDGSDDNNETSDESSSSSSSSSDDDSDSDDDSADDE